MEERQRIAYHEAAHTVASFRYGKPFYYVTIIPDNDYKGHLAFEQKLDDHRKEIVSRLVGYAADIKVDPNSASSAIKGCENDDFAYAKYEMQFLGDNALEKELKFEYWLSIASQFVDEYWKEIDAVAIELLSHRILSKREVEHIINGLDIPDLLYHYTTAQGLLGILDKKAMWATNLRYMNDSSELTYVDRLFEEEYRIAKKRHPEYGNLKLSNPFLSLISAYAICFCTNDDQLSQWRAYAHKGAGYAIGMRFKHIKQLPDNSVVIPQRIIYEPDIQRKRIASGVEAVMHVCQELKIDDPDNFEKKGADVYEAHLLANLKSYMYFKDPAFKEEKEWRAVWFGFKDDLSELLYREVSGIVVPYKMERFPSLEPTDDELLPIKEIIQGPLNKSVQGKEALDAMLKGNGYRNVEIKPSDIPLQF